MDLNRHVMMTMKQPWLLLGEQSHCCSLPLLLLNFSLPAGGLPAVTHAQKQGTPPNHTLMLPQWVALQPAAVPALRLTLTAVVPQSWLSAPQPQCTHLMLYPSNKVWLKVLTKELLGDGFHSIPRHNRDRSVNSQQ